ncbi:uncharacterized protein K02A2.6-like [Sabethes cyaneus]|uniref:uncharacterized protein K02A2.6-like n=1 Tax=Sabethes cyaneus TaxID=53552 RepID=UPI00237EDF73|nr:uncharacterized protein K02A2.6-like [Sabethes cyaneus]
MLENQAAAGQVAAGVMPASFSFEPFNSATSKFDRWLERLQVSFRIFKVPEADKRDYLLHFMGGATYDKPRLLEVRDLTLAKAKEIGFGMEMSHRGTDEMHGSRSRTEVQHIEHGSKKIKKKNVFQSTNHASSSKSSIQAGKQDKQTKVCYRCGDADHFADKCRHKATVCNHCKKRGHLEKVCQAKQRNKKTNDAHHLEEPCTIKDVFHLSAVRGFAGKFLLDLGVHRKKLTFEVDTGSPVSLISVQDKKRYFTDLDILPTTTRLVSYCENDIGILGKMIVNVDANGEEFTLPLYVAESNRHPLLGRDWLLALNLDLNRVFRPGTHSVSYCSGSDKSTACALNDLLKKFSHVFDERVGKISGVQASLSVRNGTKPVYVKARPIAFAVRAAVDMEIDKLVSDGILEKVNHSEWATPVVPVKKAGGRVRLCGDYKITLNSNLLVDDHPLPTVEELFATVAGGKRFSKLDLSQAYLQLEVRSEDRDLLTLSTHRGLFRPTRLMYGVASAPAVFQRLMEQILQGIPGVTVFIDDIRITGPDDSTHLLRLREVFKKLDEYNLRVNREKCDFFCDRIEYCGYMVDKDGIHKHYAAFLQAFDYKIRHRRSSDHFNADAMSRLPIFRSDPECEIEEPDIVEINAIQTLPLIVDELRSATLSDSTVRELSRALRTGTTSNPTTTTQDKNNNPSVDVIPTPRPNTPVSSADIQPSFSDGLADSGGFSRSIKRVEMFYRLNNPIRVFDKDEKYLTGQ